MTAEKTLPLTAFLNQVESSPNTPYLHQPREGQWTTYSYADVDRQARCIAKALTAQGYSGGDRIAILAKNSAEWLIADLAIMMAGMVSVPIYSTAGVKTIDFVLQHSDAKALFIGKLDSTDAVSNMESKVTTIGFPYDTVTTDHKWESWLAEYDPIDTLPEYKADDILSIVYTSGSTGTPKGVVLTQNNIVAGVEAASAFLPEGRVRILSYLPMAHITERSIVGMTSLYAPVEIFFNESLETFVADLQHAKVSVFISVPRLWSKFRTQVLSIMPDDQLQAMLASDQGDAVAAQIRAKLGFAECKMFGSGTAPISSSILEWFEKLGMPIQEGWGMTELTGLACNNAPYRTENLGTIGSPAPGFSMKLSEAGEILVSGDAVFGKYYLNDEATDSSFEDGWFKTGDLGAITETGAFKIIGRVKEQFKTAKGKYVSPVPIESKLSANPLIEQVCVVGSGMPQPLALVVLSEAGKADTDGTLTALGQLLDGTNSSLESHEKLDAIVVSDEEWSIESGLLTPTLKLQRTAIENKFNPLWQNTVIKGVRKESELR